MPFASDQPAASAPADNLQGRAYVIKKAGQIDLNDGR